MAAVEGRVRPRRANCFDVCARLLSGRRGLEIGGPSGIFGRGGNLPVYPVVAHLDNCNFASATLWEPQLTEGLTFQFDPDQPTGRQFIAEASQLTVIPTGEYDFVLSSHVLEHTANPLGTLAEWVRVIKPDGVLVLIVPHKEGTFDHRRPVTTLEHLIQDQTFHRGEDDLTHLTEVLSLHDFARDPRSGDPESFGSRCRRNLEFRSLHHHVFDTQLTVELVDHAGLQIEAVEALWPFHIICIVRPVVGGATLRNDRFKAADAAHFRSSPFRIDRDLVRHSRGAG